MHNFSDKIKKIFKLETKKDLFSKFFFVCYFIFSLYFFYINFSNPSTTQKIGIFCVGLFLVMLIGLKKIRIEHNKIIMILLITLPIVERFLLLKLNYGNFVDDYNYLLTNSINYANGLSLDTKYISLFPYIFSFIFSLGTLFKIFGNSYAILLVFNIIVELIGILFFYLTLKQKFNNNSAVIATLFYLYNPFSVLWIIKCCPVIIVNTLIIILIYFYNKIDFTSNKKVIIFSILTGILLCISNSFRPIMIIFVIAVLLNYMYLVIKKENFKKIICSFLIIIFVFFIGNSLFFKMVNNKLDINIKNAQSGFTLLVGSNIDSWGTWNISDATLFSQLVNDYGVELGPKKAKEMAIDRYKNYGTEVIELLNLKAKVLGTNIDNYSYLEFKNTVTSNMSNDVYNFLELNIGLRIY